MPTPLMSSPLPLKAKTIKASETEERYFDERCFIREISNSADSPDLSIALARVEPGVTTAWHSLTETSERYLIIQGTGRVELSSMPAQKVMMGDVVEIPADCHQRISNIGTDDLLFYAVCTPRFTLECYQAHE